MSESEVKFYRKIFNEFDEKQKGNLNKKDAFYAVRCCGLNPSQDQLEQAISVCEVKDSSKVTFKNFSSMVIEIKSSGCPDEDKLRKSLLSLEHRTQGGLLEIEELTHILNNRGEVISQGDVDLMLRDIETNIENEASIEDL